MQASFDDVDNLARETASLRNMVAGMLVDLGVDSFELSFNTLASLGPNTCITVDQTDTGIVIKIKTDGNDDDVNKPAE